MTKIVLDLDNDHAALLVGETDANLRMLERLLDCDIALRGNQLTIKGTEQEVQRVSELIVEMLALLESGNPLDKATVELAASLGLRENGGKGQLTDIVGDVILEHRGRRIAPKTVNQKAYIDAIRSNTVTFGIGPAGTGKTYLAMAAAVSALLANDVARIILTRPAVEAGEKLGFLPGGLMDKVDPYLRPLFDALYDMMDADTLAGHLDKGSIEVAPLAYMRGRTLNDAFIILDEAQNTTPQQMQMFLTRLGFGSRMVVTGDVTQIDLPKEQYSGLATVGEILGGIRDIGFVTFDGHDVVRHKLVQDIVNAYTTYVEKRRGGKGRVKNDANTRRRAT